MSQAYSDPSREHDPYALPNIEVFYLKAGEVEVDPSHGEEGYNEAGWYWHACFPGCLPDSDPIGPFKTEAEALADAQNEGWRNVMKLKLVTNTLGDGSQTFDVVLDIDRLHAISEDHALKLIAMIHGAILLHAKDDVHIEC